jgi:Tripartite tricarboxylate transporter TctB family
VRTDVICGAILLGVSAVFWVQRDYNNRVDGLFPDMVLVALALLGTWILLAGLRIRREQAGDGPPEGANPRMFAAAALVLIAWAVGLGLIGFTITSVLAYVAMTSLIRRGRPHPRNLAVDTTVAVAVVVGCFFVFTRVLLVPLPVSTLIGM